MSNTQTVRRNHGPAKATLSAAVGIAVLLGGASTFARWTDTDDLPLDPVDLHTGGWTFELTSTDTWFDVSPEVGEEPVLIDDLASFPIVPGDVIEGVVSVDADLAPLRGTHLTAEVEVEIPEGEGPSTVEWLAASAQVTGNSEVTVTIKFPYDDSNDYDTQAGETAQIRLGELSVTVTQTRAAYDSSPS